MPHYMTEDGLMAQSELK